MEAPPQVRKILDQIYRRTPDALGIAVGVHFGTLPPSAAGNREDVARYAAYLVQRLQPRVRPNPSTAPRAPLRMISAACYLPEHDEDCHFFHDVCGVIGVADGVGGWRAKGVDAAAFSRGLMANAFSEVAASELGKPLCPYTILDRAFQGTAASGTPGASTAVILSVAGRALKWVYVGDSGFAVFRDGKMVHRFQPQQRYFNCPFQLSAVEGSAKISEAAVGEFGVEKGDVLVAASDGLFDNVFDCTLEWMVQSGTVLGCTPEEMVGVMAGKAHNMSLNTSKDSPFSVASRESGRDRMGSRTTSPSWLPSLSLKTRDSSATSSPFFFLKGANGVLFCFYAGL